MRAVRRLAAALTWLAVAVGVVVVGAILHLDSRPARTFVRQQALETTNDAIRGRVTIGHLHTLTPWAVRVQHVSLFDPSGRRVVHVEQVRARPDLPALIGGEVGLRQLDVARGRVRMVAGPDGAPSIAAALSPREATETEEPTTVAIDRLRVRQLDVYGALLPLEVRSLSLAGAVRSAEALQLRVHHARATLQRHGDSLATVRQLRAAVDTRAGARSTAELTVTANGDRARLRATYRMQAPAADRPSHLAASLQLDRLSPRTLSRAGFDGVLASPLRGRITAAGRPDDLRAEAQLRSAAGGLEVRARLREQQRVTATVRTDGLVLSELLAPAPAVRVAGEVHGTMRPLERAPHEVTLETRALRIEGRTVPDLRLHAAVDEEAVRVRDLDAPRLRGELDLSGTVGFDGSVDVRIAADLPSLTEPTMPELPALVTGALRADVRLSATPGPEGVLRARGRIALANVAVENARADRLTVAGSARGTLEAPRIDARLQGRGVRADTTPIGAVDLDVQGGPQRFRVRADVGSEVRSLRVRALVAREPDGVRIDAPALVATVQQQRWSGAVRAVRIRSDRVGVGMLRLRSGQQRIELEGLYDFDGWIETRVQAVAVQIEAIAALLPSPLPDARGRLDLDVQASGPVELPSLQAKGRLADAQVDRFRVAEAEIRADVERAGRAEPESMAVSARVVGFHAAGRGPFGARLRTAYDHPDVGFRGVITSADGVLARFDASAQADVPSLIRNPQRARTAAARAPWELEVRIPGTRVDEIAAAVGTRIDAPAQLWLALRARGGGPRPPEADLRSRVRWLEPPEALVDSPCTPEARPQLDAQLAVREGRAQLDARMSTRRGEALALEASAPVAMQQWMEHGPRGPPAVQARLRTEGIELGELPFVCRFAGGPVVAQLQAADLFTDRARIRVHARSPQLDLGSDIPAVRLRLDARLEQEVVRTRARLRSIEGGGATLQARLPIEWGGDRAVPRLHAEAPLRAAVRLDRTPLQALLAAVPAVGFADGRIHGRITAEGRDLDSLQLGGRVELQDAGLSLVPLGQRWQRMQGAIAFDGRRVVIDDIRARDRDGRVSVNGQVRLGELPRSRGRLRIEAQRFPIRTQGFVVARLTGRALVVGRFLPERGEVDVTLRDVGVRLPASPPPNVQSLDPHPDIVIAGKEREPEVAPVEGEAKPGYPIIVDIDASRPFWIRRDDFSAQVEAQVRAVIDQDVRLTGSVQLRRGFFELAGARFELDEGRIQFTGSEEIDPVVRIVAVHDLRRHPGETLSVTVAGPVSEPELTFSSTIAGVETVGDALALLLGGPGGQPGAVEEQAVSFLSGMMTGLLTSVLREEFGPLVPVISVSMGDALGTARIRAGIDATRLVPVFLRDIVLAAYVEGFVETGPNAGPRTDSAGGVLLEVLFPHDLQATAEFQPGGAWSLDFAWAP